jgi:hypothetical protein
MYKHKTKTNYALVFIYNFVNFSRVAQTQSKRLLLFRFATVLAQKSVKVLNN